MFSPSEYFAEQIMYSIAGAGTNDAQLIRCIISRYSIDMNKVKKYYKKLYNKDLLYFAMKGIGSDKDVITEVLAFRNPKRINEIKQKFQEKYGKDLVEEIKGETSGDYR